MSERFPLGFLMGFLTVQKVSCFLCAISYRGNRKLLAQPRINTVGSWFPEQETVSTPGNQKFPRCFLLGFLARETPCPAR